MFTSSKYISVSDWGEKKNPVKFNLTLIRCVTNCFSTFLLKYFTAVLSVLSTPYLLTPYRSVGGVIASSGLGCAEV